MQVLTPTGYRDIVDLAVGGEVSAFDIDTGAPIINLIESIEPIDAAEWSRAYPIDTPPFASYLVNGEFILFGNQSIWTSPTTVKHASLLQVGDTIYDDANGDLVITSFEETGPQGVWYRLVISGDHSFISDGLTLHNASRFWVGGTGTWDNVATTNWSATSGGASGSSPPVAGDDATFNGSSGTGTVTPNATLALANLTTGAFVGTLAFNTNNNNITISAVANHGGTAVRTLNLGNGTWTFTSSAAVVAQWSIGTATNLTLNCNSSVLSFTGSNTASQMIPTFGPFTYNIIRITGSWIACNIGNVVGPPTFGTLDVQASIGFRWGVAITLNAISIGAGVSVGLYAGTSLTLGSAFSISGAPGAQLTIGDNTTTVMTFSCAAGAVNLNWATMMNVTFSGGATFVAKNSNARNCTGITVTPPMVRQPTLALGV